MSELAAAMRLMSGQLPTCVQRVNWPVHQGKPNPFHGKFFFVGSIPGSCYDPSRNNGRGGSRFYDTEELAIQAAIDGGASRIQRCDCSFVDVAAFKAAMEAHECNLDAAQGEIDRRAAEGEDMAGATVCPRTYAINKPATV